MKRIGVEVEKLSVRYIRNMFDCVTVTTGGMIIPFCNCKGVMLIMFGMMFLLYCSCSGDLFVRWLISVMFLT